MKKKLKDIMQVLYFNQVCGYAGMFRHLTKEQHDTYFQTLARYNIEWFNNINDVFPKGDEHRESFLEGTDGFFEYEDCLYTIESSYAAQNSMRTDEFFHQLTEEYNSYLDKPVVISYNNIEIEDLTRVRICEWDCGTEGIMFSE